MLDIEYSVITSDVIKSFDCNNMQQGQFGGRIQFIFAFFL